MPRSQGLPGPQGWDCHGSWPDHRHIQPGEGTLGWEGKYWPLGPAGGAGGRRRAASAGLQGPWGGHACGMSEASSCLAQAHSMSPRPSHPRTLPGKSLRPAPPGDSGKQPSPAVGLDKGFLWEQGLRTLCSPTPQRAGAGAGARPQAGREKQTASQRAVRPEEPGKPRLRQPLTGPPCLRALQGGAAGRLCRPTAHIPEGHPPGAGAGGKQAEAQQDV